MPLYPLFIVLIALALRDQYSISFELILGFLLWSPRWRCFKHGKLPFWLLTIQISVAASIGTLGWWCITLTTLRPIF